MLIISSYQSILEAFSIFNTREWTCKSLHADWSTKIPFTVQVCKVCPFMYLEVLHCVVVLHPTHFCSSIIWVDNVDGFSCYRQRPLNIQLIHNIHRSISQQWMNFPNSKKKNFLLTMPFTTNYETAILLKQKILTKKSCCVVVWRQSLPWLKW